MCCRKRGKIMGTMHLICVLQAGEYKVAQYGQYDGSPQSQGYRVLNFLTEEMKRDLFEKKVSGLSFVTPEELDQMWVNAGADPGAERVSLDISEKFQELYPENSSETSADILGLIQNSERPLKLRNNIDFAGDVLCEWAYVVDLDKNTFEVYKGFNKSPLSKNERFAYLQYTLKYSQDMFFPIKHVISFNLDNLPDIEQFLAAFINDSEDDEE
jgi:hypothetical protein